MSPKYSSLAFDEKEQSFQEIVEEFTPELNLLIKARHTSDAATEDPIRIAGCVTISF